MEKLKAGYGKVVQWVDDHPHATLWLATGVLVAVLVLK